MTIKQACFGNHVTTLKHLNKQGVRIKGGGLGSWNFQNILITGRRSGGDFCIFFRDAGGVVAMAKQGVGLHSK